MGGIRMPWQSTRPPIRYAVCGHRARTPAGAPPVHGDRPYAMGEQIATTVKLCPPPLLLRT